MKYETQNKGCSVIITTYNRVEFLKKCIDSHLHLNYPLYEIIIINNGSTDGTKEYLSQISDKRIKIHHELKNVGLSIGRNIGIHLAQYEIVAFTDDDCIVDKNWLLNLVTGFSDQDIAFVIGQTYYIKKDYKGYFPERLVHNLNAQWPKGCNIAFRKSIFQKIGLFDDRFFQYNNEDTELAIRSVSFGLKYAQRPEAITYHQKALWTKKSLLNSAKNASVWPLLKKKYPVHYLVFGGPVKAKICVNPEDYLYFLTFPVLIPLLFLRYIFHGKKDFEIFFTKWPLYFILRRYCIYKEAIRNKVLML